MGGGGMRRVTTLLINIGRAVMIALSRARKTRADYKEALETFDIVDTFAEPKKPESWLDAYDSSLLEFHNIFDSRNWWRLREPGIVVNGDDGNFIIPRTKGEPITVRKIMDRFYNSIFHWSQYYNVPAELIIACIATETGGKSNAIRLEPGHTSDEETPSRISVGLMQTLISTARSTMCTPEIDRHWLLEPDNSICAGVSYINGQRSITKLDPVLVGAAYNAGGVYADCKEENPWHLRCYPIGTGRHVTRFVEFFNDAVFVLYGNSG